VVAFGGVPAVGIRSSERIHAQPNTDNTLLDRAKMLVQGRDPPSETVNNNFVLNFLVVSIPNEVLPLTTDTYR
jgi:hypothetical protein